jgi:PDDEXK-like uncharacterized protein DUF3799
MLVQGSRMTFAEYAALEAVNISSLLALLVSPKEYQWRKTHARPDTAAYRLGRLTHCAVLEPMRLLKDFVASPFADFRTKAAQAWKAEQEAAGKTVITEAQFQAAEAMQRAVWNHPLAKRHVMEGEPEATFTWTDARTGIDCRGRIDLLNGSTVDLKSARSVAPTAFGRDAARFFYHVRMAFYRDGVRAVTGQDLPVVLVCVQKEPPWDVAVYRLSDEVLDQGRRIYEGLLDTLRICLDSGEFPGVCESEELPLTLPTWAGAAGQAEETITLTAGGEPLAF